MIMSVYVGPEKEVDTAISLTFLLVLPRHCHRLTPFHEYCYLVYAGPLPLL